MPEKHLKSLLHDLQAELDSAKNLDPETSRRLNEALSDIVAAIDDPDSPPPEAPNGLVEEILEADHRFEVAHPRISESLRRILATLSNTGI